MLPNVKVRDLSELIKVEREQTPEIYSISNQIRSQIPGCVDVKIEKSSQSDEEFQIKVEPKDEVDVNDYTWLVDDVKFKSVLELLKRTIDVQQRLCDQCGTICDTRNDLKIHNDQYHRAQSTFDNHPSAIGCVKCSMRFPTYRLRHHHMFIHRNVSPLMCRYCNKCFTSITKAEQHTRYAHNRFGSEPMFTCRQCYMSFHQTNHYERHLHTHYRRFKCTICFRRFSNPYQFQDHLVEHSEAIKTESKESESGSVKSENLSECSSVKSEKSLLVKEEPMDDPSPLKCEHCSNSFTSKESLLLHMAHHADGLKPYNCPHCRWFYFDSKRKLDRHLKKFHSNGGSLGNENKEFDTKSEPSSGAQCRWVMVDEVGDVDMAEFEEFIQEFLS